MHDAPLARNQFAAAAQSPSRPTGHGSASAPGTQTPLPASKSGLGIGRMAIVHDYLTQRGGAERVVLAMMQAFPDATLYTSLYEPLSTFSEFGAFDVRTLPINRVGVFRHHHRVAFPFFAPAFSSCRIDADVVLCSSSGWAHGVRTRGTKIVYCHTPARWLYQTRLYAGVGQNLIGLHRLVAAGALRPILQSWDKRAASTAQKYLANSRVVQERVRQLYGIEAELVPPPVRIDTSGPQTAMAGVDDGFLLCVSRLLPYKNVSKVIEAMRLLPDQRLVVVGAGPEMLRLQRSAPANVTLVGSVSDRSMRWLYARCTGVIAASHEDFGLVPLEAAAFGKPTAALRWGGFLDTIREYRTGVFFDEPEPCAIAAAVRQLEGRFDAAILRAHIQSYSPEAFSERLRLAVDVAMRAAA